MLVSSQFVTMLNVIEVSVPTLSAHHLLMDDGDDRVGRLSSNHLSVTVTALASRGYLGKNLRAARRTVMAYGRILRV